MSHSSDHLGKIMMAGPHFEQDCILDNAIHLMPLALLKPKPYVGMPKVGLGWNSLFCFPVWIYWLELLHLPFTINCLFNWAMGRGGGGRSWQRAAFQGQPGPML